MATNLSPERFQYVYVVDTEFVALPGEQQRPVCLVARGFNQGRDVEVFFDTPAPSPFADPSNTLFLGYNLSAEFQTMLALGWMLPAQCVDLYIEFLNMINGVWRGAQSLRDLGTGLPDAIAHFGGNPLEFWKADKDAERQYILDNGTVPPIGVSPEAHRRRILDYCREDVADRLALEFAEHFGLAGELERRTTTDPVKGRMCQKARRIADRLTKSLPSPHSRMTFLRVLADLLSLQADWEDEAVRLSIPPPEDGRKWEHVPNVVTIGEDGIPRPISYELKDSESADSPL